MRTHRIAAAALSALLAAGPAPAPSDPTHFVPADGRSGDALVRQPGLPAAARARREPAQVAAERGFQRASVHLIPRDAARRLVQHVPRQRWWRGRGGGLDGPAQRHDPGLPGPSSRSSPRRRRTSGPPMPTSSGSATGPAAGGPAPGSLAARLAEHQRRRAARLVHQFGRGPRRPADPTLAAQPSALGT